MNTATLPDTEATKEPIKTEAASLIDSIKSCHSRATKAAAQSTRSAKAISSLAEAARLEAASAEQSAYETEEELKKAQAITAELETLLQQL